MTQSKWQAYSRLMRIDKPIERYYFGQLIGLCGLPLKFSRLAYSDCLYYWHVLYARAAGVINDFADRKIDGSVERTKIDHYLVGQ